VPAGRTEARQLRELAPPRRHHSGFTHHAHRRAVLGTSDRAEDDGRRRKRLAAADVLPLVPWLIFVACIAVIGCRVLSGRAQAKKRAAAEENDEQQDGEAAGHTTA
jgi:hypothetical protein